MKPHPRIRKTVKWGGPLVSAALLAVMVWSAWYWVQWSSQPGAHFWIDSGTVIIDGSLFRSDQGHPRSWKWGTHRNPMGWRLSWMITGNLWVVYLPIWPAPAAAILLSTAAWRLDTLARRRSRLNLCPKCNYDHTGLAPGAVCPECGSAVSRLHCGGMRTA